MMIIYNQLIIGISSHNYFRSQLFSVSAQVQHFDDGDGGAGADDDDTISLSHVDRRRRFFNQLQTSAHPRFRTYR